MNWMVNLKARHRWLVGDFNMLENTNQLGSLSQVGGKTWKNIQKTIKLRMRIPMPQAVYGLCDVLPALTRDGKALSPMSQRQFSAQPSKL
jgi:hypothetical protein